jgi:LuxR family maltose regulon positive regulatory protein
MKKDLRPSAFLDTVLVNYQAKRTSEKTRQLLEPLSERETDVLRYLRTNMTTPEIATEMMIGVNTVRTHIKNLYQKMGVHKRSEAVRFARNNNLFPVRK